MTDQKPREFFIGWYKGDNNDPEIHEIEPGSKTNIQNRIHVIEKSAYDRCVEVALNTMTRCNNILNERDQLRIDLSTAIEALENAPSMDTETFENIGTPFRNDFDTWTAVTRELLAKLQGEKK